MQLDSLIWETVSPRTHKPKIVNELLYIDIYLFTNPKRKWTSNLATVLQYRVIVDFFTIADMWQLYETGFSLRLVKIPEIFSIKIRFGHLLD